MSRRQTQTALPSSRSRRVNRPHGRKLLLEQLETRRVLAVELISLAGEALDSTPADLGSLFRDVTSDDGRYVVFVSDSVNVVAGQADTNSTTDIFLRDRQTGTTTLVSHIGDGVTAGDARSRYPSISGDGSTIAFQSEATNLVSGFVDANGSAADVFRFDVATGVITLVSRIDTSAVTTGNDQSLLPSVSDDGSKILFRTWSSDLLTGGTDLNGGADLYVHDSGTGINTLVTHAAGSPTTAANGLADDYQISALGNKVTYRSTATDLVAGFVDGNLATESDIFVYDVAGGSNTLVSHNSGSLVTSGNGWSVKPRISDDGSRIVYRSEATNLAAGVTDTNGLFDVFVYETGSGVNTLVSHTASSTLTAADGPSFTPRISGNGNRIVYVSQATNLVTGFVEANTPTDEDVYVYTLATGTNDLVSSIPGSPVTSGNEESSNPVISDDGNLIAFTSRASDLVAGQSDPNGVQWDVFLRDVSAGSTTLVTRTATSATTTGNNNGASDQAYLSGDGGSVFYSSNSTDLVAGLKVGGDTDTVFGFDTGTSTNELVSLREGPASASANGFSYTTPWSLFLSSNSPTNETVSDDGRYAVFQNTANNLVVGQNDTNSTIDVFLYDRLTGDMRLVSHTGDGVTAGDLSSFDAAINDDGTKVVYSTDATNLVPGVTDANGTRDVYVYDIATGTNTLVSHSAASLTTTADGNSNDQRLSGDGSKIAFLSNSSNLIAGFVDGNTAVAVDLYVYDVATGTNTLVSHVSGSATTSGNDEPRWASFSDDGGLIAFESRATDLVAGVTDVNGSQFDVYLHNTTTGTNQLVSHSATSTTTTANDLSEVPFISGDGSTIGLTSRATDLVAGISDTNGDLDVFSYDVATSTMTLVSHISGSTTTTGNDYSLYSSMSDDGSRIAFLSEATDLVSGVTDTNFDPDVFVYDATTGAVSLISYASGDPTTAGNGKNERPAISADGTAVAWASESTDLASGTDNNTFSDAFVHDLTTGTTRLASHIPSDVNSTGSPGGVLEPSISANGTFTLFVSVSDDLVANDFNNAPDVFGFEFNKSPTANPDVDSVGEDGPAIVVDLTANDTDPNLLDDLEIQSIDLTGTAGSVTVNPDNDTVTYDPDGQFETLAAGQTATDTFTYIISDGNGGSDSAAVTVTVNGVNDAPVAADDTFAVDENSPTGTSVGTVSASDIDTSDTLTFSIIAGNPNNAFDIDNSGLITVDNSAELDFETTPDFVLTVQVDDGNGGIDTAAITINLNDLVEGSPIDLDNGVLTITGTSGPDSCSITAGFLSITVTCDFAPPETFSFFAVDEIEVTLGDGDDNIDLGLIFADATINGGEGNDTIDGGWGDDTIIGGPGNDELSGGPGSDLLRGGSGNDVIFGNTGSDTLVGGGGADILLGGFGSDTLIGGGGRDLLIGGAGADTLEGRGGQDILIGAFTTFDGDDAALDAILEVWNSGDSYVNRVNTLRNGSGPILNGVSLNAGTTVIDEFATDELTGNGARDWFFADLGGLAFDDDLLTDQVANEFIDLL